MTRKSFGAVLLFFYRLWKHEGMFWDYGKDVILTRDGLKKLEEELENLKTVKRQEVADRLKQAISFGDLSENSEYEDAKNEQAFIEGRILTLEKMVRNAKIIEDDAVVEYKIVGTVEADPMNNRISNESPVGRGILGHKAGEIVDVEVPAGILKYEILDVKNG